MEISYLLHRQRSLRVCSYVPVLLILLDRLITVVVFFNYFEIITWDFSASRYLTGCFLCVVRRIPSSPLMFLYFYFSIYFRPCVIYLFYSLDCLFVFDIVFGLSLGPLPLLLLT